MLTNSPVAFLRLRVIPRMLEQVQPVRGLVCVVPVGGPVLLLAEKFDHPPLDLGFGHLLDLLVDR